MMKHAYLIIAHNEFEVLQKLVSALDYEDNDIYIHIDKKVKGLPTVAASKSRVFMLKNRIDVRWGSLSQIKTEMLLFEEALRGGNYDYYHLISGTHLPVQNHETIVSFFEQNEGKEIMHIWDYDARDVSNKLSTYHLLMPWYNSSIVPIRKFAQLFWRINLKIQRSIGIDRSQGATFVKADNWVSLTKEAVSYLVDNKKKIFKKYRMTFCADEYFAPTVLSACGGQFKIMDCPNLLFAKFNCANAEELEIEDVKSLVGTDYLFARKFTSSKPEVMSLAEELYGE